MSWMYDTHDGQCRFKRRKDVVMVFLLLFLFSIAALCCFLVVYRMFAVSWIWPADTKKDLWKEATGLKELTEPTR